MKLFRKISLLFLLIVFLSSCSKTAQTNEAETKLEEFFIENIKSENQLYIYGETHGVDEIIDAEFEYWKRYYYDGMRHLFMEVPYYTAQFLNIWMHEDDNDILDMTHGYAKGSLSHTDSVYNLFILIKNQCPETIFHGTDVGHQADSVGARYLRYLLENDLYDTKEHELARECIKQGYEYYGDSGEPDHAYRERMMIKNFTDAYEEIAGENIMGIYGSAHVHPKKTQFYGDTPSMAMELKKNYGDNYHYSELDKMLLAFKTLDPIRMDEVKINSKIYKASYFGIDDTKFKNIESREFWRIEDAYEDFKNCPLNGDFLPYDNYPMPIDLEEVFMLKINFDDGSNKIFYYLSIDDMYYNRESTTGFSIEE